MKNEVVNTDALLDEAEEVIDNLATLVDETTTIVKNNPLVIVGVAVVALGVGGYLGYRYGVKRTALKYEEIMEREIHQAKVFYKRLAKEGEYETPESAVDALVPEEVVEAISSYQGKGRDRTVPYNKITHVPPPPVVAVESVEVTTNNVFTASGADPRDWDYNVEIASRDTTKPYVISFEEFNENEEGHEQATLAYFSSDDTLVDEKDQPIDNTEYTVGDDNLSRFGHGSNDRNVVYVRNERLGMDFEVVRSNGSYSQSVLGIDPETTIRHSHRRPGRKFRGTDE